MVNLGSPRDGEGRKKKKTIKGPEVVKSGMSGARKVFIVYVEQLTAAIEGLSLNIRDLARAQHQLV